jgi:hypothetical protein
LAQVLLNFSFIILPSIDRGFDFLDDGMIDVSF